ncbi:response regulator [Phototrophicus methaneseepsis]|uniref:Response regulator n=1 Tax=Phototrophicus methaneseepsis TaxID=2710758 RepID=A0A7S8IFS6_9CHLR|nr:response regulator [Phototrophicus methaneseepsis]QPC83907.1 response regulator [Phototrophicus methaneseepsis]
MLTKIMVVDDEAILREDISAYLEMEGYNVVTAHNGHAAIEYLKTDTVDLVISDIHMPEVNGYELLQYIRTDLGLVDLPFIFLSGVYDMNQEKCLELGASAYIPKPFSIVELSKTIDRIVDSDD